MSIKSIKQVRNLTNKRVLVRVDFNVPMKGKKILDDSRLVESLSTIQYLLKQKAKVILVSHLGRPKGVDKKLSLLPIKNRLEELLKKKIEFTELSKLAKLTKLSGLIMLENIRFYSEEEKNDDEFCKKLASVADIFVLDGFAVAHRDSASVTGVAKHLPSYAGMLLEKEITGLNKVMQNPNHPFVVVLGGAKIETKLPIIKNLLPYNCTDF